MGNLTSVSTGCNLEGAIARGVGSFDMNDLGVPNDSIKSIKIPAGFRMTVYEHAGFQGASRAFNGDGNTINFCFDMFKFDNTNTNIKDNISSYRIEKIAGFENVNNSNIYYYLLILAIFLLIAYINRERLMNMIKAKK